MERISNKKQAGNSEVPVFFLLKCLLLSYILSAVLLLLLAFALYKLGLSAGTVSIAISAIYVIATFAAGFIAGKKLQTRKFIWGMLLGALYFLILVIISLLVNQSVGELGNSFFTTLVLCAAGGTLGGMLG